MDECFRIIRGGTIQVLVSKTALVAYRGVRSSILQNQARKGTPRKGAPEWGPSSLLVRKLLSSPRGSQQLGSALFLRRTAYSWKYAQNASGNCVDVKTPPISTRQLKCKTAATHENRTPTFRTKQRHYPQRPEPLDAGAIAGVQETQSVRFPRSNAKRRDASSCVACAAGHAARSRSSPKSFERPLRVRIKERLTGKSR